MVTSIYDNYKQLLFHIAYGILLDRSLAEEAVQESLLHMSVHQKSLPNDPTYLKNYICLITKYIAINMQKNRN